MESVTAEGSELPLRKPSPSAGSWRRRAETAGFRVMACELLGLLLILAQLVGIGRAFLVPDRFFCWSPHDSRAEYRITAWRGDEVVEGRRVLRRYGYRPEGTDWHSIHNVFRVLEVAESRLPPDDRWQLEVEFRVNLGAWRTWRFPSGQEGEGR